MTFKKGNKFWLGRKHTEESKQKMSIARKKAIAEGHGHIFKKGNKINTGRKHTDEHKRNITIGLKKAIAEGRITTVFKKGNKLWHNLDYVKAVFKGMAVKPNKPEKQLDVLIRSVTADFEYNGNFAQGITIGGCVPDFVNINGRKQVIELFGDWFHSKEFAERFNRKFVSPEDKITHYKQYGFDCLVIWESELTNKETVLNKINNFIASNSEN